MKTLYSLIKEKAMLKRGEITEEEYREIVIRHCKDITSKNMDTKGKINEGKDF